jgi:hypothetical protein
VSNNYKKSSRKRKKKIQNRLENINEFRTQPMLNFQNILFELSQRTSATVFGGIGLVNKIANTIGLQKFIDDNLGLFKIHNPYFESDHILTMAYNILCGGTCLEDIERLRNDISFLDALGAKRIPAPTTAGDFLRRFKANDVIQLMNILNSLNKTIWNATVKKKSTDAILDIDDTIQMVYGEKKEGIALSYNGKWGFAPLVITEVNTGTHLYLVNRSGNKTFDSKVSDWIDKSIETVKDNFKNIYIRGDSEFCLTEDFDKWNKIGNFFTFSYKCLNTLVYKALLLPGNKWRRLWREKKHEDNGKPNYKQTFIQEKGYRDIRLIKEYVAEFRYQPSKCKKEYRMIAVKKIIEVTEGQDFLFEENRFFFYITNIEHMTPEEIIRFINGRCNHENKIQQLKDKDGVHALKMPAAEFTANWAYMVIGALAWNMKSWVGLFMKSKSKSEEVISMEMKRFQNYLINIPCQIITSGRYITYRFLNYTSWLDEMFRAFSSLKRFNPI